MSTAENHAPHGKLEHFPISFFAMVMGTAGLSIAFQRASHVVPSVAPIASGILVLAGLLFVILIGVYGLKIIRYPHAAQAEILHPVRLHFVPTISISLILLSIAMLEVNRGISEALLLLGAPLHLFLTLMVLNLWFNRDHFQTVHLNPAWFIPIVGNILAPIAGTSLGYIEASWFFFAIGLVFWIPMLTIILNRILFHQALPGRLLPTLFILIAPPAIGFLSYLKLTGTLDPFARVLFGFAAFLTLFLLTQISRLMRLPFFLSWWAYSFPLAAITITTFAMHEKTGVVAYFWLGFAFLALASFLIGGLLIRTMIAIRRHEICQPE